MSYFYFFFIWNLSLIRYATCNDYQHANSHLSVSTLFSTLICIYHSIVRLEFICTFKKLYKCLRNKINEHEIKVNDHDISEWAFPFPNITYTSGDSFLWWSVKQWCIDTSRERWFPGIGMSTRTSSHWIDKRTRKYTTFL